MSDKFTCAACGKTYDKGRSDEEAMAESKLLWGEQQVEDLAVICDDCFNGGKDDALAEHHRHQVKN